VATVRVQKAASFRIDEIYRYTCERGGTAQAEACITGLFKAFSKISSHEVMSRPIPAEFELEGFFFHYEKHFVYWKTLGNGDVGIVTILHEGMHQIDRFCEGFGL